MKASGQGGEGGEGLGRWGEGGGKGGGVKRESGKTSDGCFKDGHDC